MTQENTTPAPQSRAWMLTGVHVPAPKAVRLARHMPPVDGVRFAVLDGAPVRFTTLEAWWFAQGEWQPLHPAVAGHEANLLCDWAFSRPLPPLPGHAFGGLDV